MLFNVFYSLVKVCRLIASYQENFEYFENIASAIFCYIKWHVWGHICDYIDPKFTEFWINILIYGTKEGPHM